MTPEDASIRLRPSAAEAFAASRGAGRYPAWFMIDYLMSLKAIGG